MKASQILAVDHLSLSLKTAKRSKPLVRHVSFDIYEKKITGLIGSSGCGKSLTCHAIMGLLPTGIVQTSGAVRFEQMQIDTLPAGHLRTLRGNKLAMILQNPMSCFDPVFTIAHHFRETLASHGIATTDHLAKANAALEEVGFDNPGEILSLYPFQMSGGMLQRVMVALALMMEVALLIADEPTTDLDVVSQARVLKLLSEMRTQHNMAILLVTHDLSVVSHLADDVIVMQKGEIVDQGIVSDIFTHRTGHPYTRSLLEAHLSLYDDRLAHLYDTNETLPDWNIERCN